MSPRALSFCWPWLPVLRPLRSRAGSQDSSGSVVVGTKVAVINTETGVRREIETNEEGYYTVPLLARGQYLVQAAQPGFKEVVRSGLTLDEGQNLRLDFKLEVGQVSEKIEVSGAAPLFCLETERPMISTVVPSQKILDMPTYGRNPLQFALLVPGVRATAPLATCRFLPIAAIRRPSPAARPRPITLWWMALLQRTGRRARS